MLTLDLLILICVILLAWANGSNDNVKGVATLLGTNTASYKKAITWGTFATAAGAFCALFASQGLIAAFSGKGLVPDDIAASPQFASSVALAAAGTVTLASRFGFPVSTTHALVGALIGAGLISSGQAVNLSALWAIFLMPLLLSPLIAFTLTGALVIGSNLFSKYTTFTSHSCLCVDSSPTISFNSLSSTSCLAIENPVFTLNNEVNCDLLNLGSIARIKTKSFLEIGHYLSAGMMSFARGLNDTPKIMGLLLLTQGIQTKSSGLFVIAAMAMGGILGGKKVAHTMAHKITSMTPANGFCANLTTGLLVIFASRFGIPVSTTHVSCGALFGLGAITDSARGKVITQIVAAWLITLPIAALLATLSYALIK